MDPAEFAEAAAPLHTRLTRAVWLLCGDRSLAEDCAQEALLRAWHRVEAGDPLRSLEAWTTTVALNECRSRGRRRQAEGRAFGRLGAPRAEAPGADADLGGSGEVVEAVRALPQRQREVVVLHYFLDLDVAQIAERIGRSTGAVKNALFHARASLEGALATRAGADLAAQPDPPRRTSDVADR